MRVFRRALSLPLALLPGCVGDAPGTGVRADAGGVPQTPDGRVSDAALDDDRLPPPISGGTLLITRDGAWAVAADPDVDRVSIVGIGAATPGCSGCDRTPKLVAAVQLAKGAEPGRLAEDGARRVHVVLRRGGAIAAVDLESGELIARRPVCPSPRGIAYDPAEDILHVACASGDLVSLSPLTGEVTRRIALDVDLRDVVVVPGGLVVSRFKSAELIRVGSDGSVVERTKPTSIERGPQDLSSLQNDPFEPGVAWRTLSTSAGHVFMLHQYGLARPIDLGETAPPTPYHAQSGSSCGAIVLQTVSTLAPGSALDMGMPMPVVALSVDAAVSSDGAWLVAAHAGASADRVTIYESDALPSLGRTPVRCASNAGRVIVHGQPVAVALHPARVPSPLGEDDWLVVQTRSPAQLGFYRGFTSARAVVSLNGLAPNPAHDLFHLESGRGIACAQCHPEGGEDGRVWQFEPQGARRTQALWAGLDGTAPFHWDGDLPTIEALLDETFVRRMGGPSVSPSLLTDMTEWLFSLSPPAPIVNPDTPAAVRGRGLFESAEVGCTECHAGAAVAKSESFDVGVESPGKFQIPALRGVGYRAPFLHDGCAGTLRERFAPPCGDDRHGKTSHLSSTEIDDLLAYLESL